MEEPKQVIIMRIDTDPKMRKGKMIAQGAHASLAVVLDMMSDYDPWNDMDMYQYIHRFKPKHYKEKRLKIEEGTPLQKWLDIRFKKIVVGGTKAQIINSYQEAKRQNIPCALIEDAGLTEFGGEVTITCCAIGPDDPEKIDKITGNFELL
jgi:peptidyl-tRNA hydrolase, PTH2 family